MNDAQKKLVLAWIDKANNDIRNVELLLKSHEINLPTDTMAFHCQQAVEIRYPDSLILPTIYEINEYYQIAIYIRNFIMDKIDIVR